MTDSSDWIERSSRVRHVFESGCALTPRAATKEMMMTQQCSRRLCQVHRWLWTILGGLSLAVLLLGCAGQPCQVAAVPTPPALLTGANGIFYLGQAGGVDVTALRASDGTRLWSEQPVEHVVGASDGTVFFRNSSVLEARRDQDRSLLWQDSVPSFTALAEDHGVVYVASTDSVRALRASDGASLWQQTLPLTPWVLTAAAGSLYLVGSTSVIALRERDGSVLWQADASGEPTSTLAIDADAVYLGSADQVQVWRASDGARLWQATTSTWGRFLAAGAGLAYLITEQGVNALRGSDGSLAWQTKQSNDPYQTAVLPLGATVVYVEMGQRLEAVETSNGSVLWQHETSLPPGGTPALAATNGAIGVGTVSASPGATCGSTVFTPTAASVRASDGTALWSTHTPSP